TTWWTTLGMAAAAAAIPIIIHLLNRRRFRVVVWAAMRFLLAAQKQNTRRMRLEQIILLCVRTLLILLIILAMASVMPWAESLWNYLWPEGAQGLSAHSGRTHKILVIDGSLSMDLKGKNDDKSAYDRVRDKAAAIVEDSPRGDSFSIVLMTGNAPRRIGIKPSAKKENVLREINETLRRHPHGNADVAAAMVTVDQLLAESAGK